jgi:hypothetical protein
MFLSRNARIIATALKNPTWQKAITPVVLGFSKRIRLFDATRASNAESRIFSGCCWFG